MSTTLLLLASAGLFAGFLAGLFGIGGGIILVPALGFILFSSVPPEHLMRVCLATSLATIVFSSTFAAWQQHRAGNCDWSKVRQLSVGVAIGATLGGLIAANMPELVLRTLFATFATYVGVQMWFAFQPKIPVTFNSRSALVAGSITGAMSSWVGIGGGNILVPYLLSTGVGIKKAAGITSPVGVVVALFATLGYAISASNNPPQVPGAIGFVVGSAFLTIVSTSFLGIFLGLRLSNVLPGHQIKRAFAVLLLLTGIRYWIGIFTA